MTHTRYGFILTLLTLSFILFSGCKKEEEATKEFMKGSVTCSIPTYVVTNEIVSAYAEGITTPKNPAYFWYSPELGIDTLWDRNITFKVPQTPGTYSIELTAEAPGYYISTKNIEITAINTSSVSGLKASDRTFTDPRDGYEYMIKDYGNLTWFVENLAYAGTPEAPVGVAYENSGSIDKLFGRLYSWNEATSSHSGSGLGNGPQGICPEGWSIPTGEDWEDLAKALNGGEPLDFLDTWEGLGSICSASVTLNGENMWPYSPDNNHSNDSGWNGIPVGNSSDNYQNFENVSVYGMWWSSKEVNDGQEACYRYIHYNSSAFNLHYVDKDSYGISVRCVKLK
ncbi:MAG: FISUMP domain-containing protein [Bacteroidales bacterium]|nr:FISUMP domain-containing protein [Bacteroidales bacterium]MDY5823560.1 FISUMP domain-containing protein [Candidatus Coprenecus sp.]